MCPVGCNPDVTQLDVGSGGRDEDLSVRRLIGDAAQPSFQTHGCRCKRSHANSCRPSLSPIVAQWPRLALPSPSTVLCERAGSRTLVAAKQGVVSQIVKNVCGSYRGAKVPGEHFKDRTFRTVAKQSWVKMMWRAGRWLIPVCFYLFISFLNAHSTPIASALWSSEGRERACAICKQLYEP